MSTQPLLAPEVPSSLPLPSSPKRKPRFAASNFIWLLAPWVLGTAVGFLVPHYHPSRLSPTYQLFSAIVGWVYFSAWSISFYPQLWTNFRRKSVVGLSLDFQLLNLLGFACYAIYNCALYYSPVVRRQYAALHYGQPPAVHSNDVFFAIHALLATLATLWQCVAYERGGARPARASVVVCVVVTFAAAAWGAAIALLPTVDPDPCSRDACPPESLLTWLTWLYFLSLVKLSITLTKYVPQVVLNCRRQSTVGFNIWQFILDFEGGVLSTAQQVMDAAACDAGSKWAPITGNPVKFALGSASMFFDIIFAVQHFCLFPDWRRQIAERAMEADVERAVLVRPGEGSEDDEDARS